MFCEFFIHSYWICFPVVFRLCFGVVFVSAVFLLVFVVLCLMYVFFCFCSFVFVLFVLFVFFIVFTCRRRARLLLVAFSWLLVRRAFILDVCVYPGG